MPDKTWWKCPKCETSFRKRDIIARQKGYCKYCGEPSVELYDICGLTADWSSGEINTKKPTKAK